LEKNRRGFKRKVHLFVNINVGERKKIPIDMFSVDEGSTSFCGRIGKTHQQAVHQRERKKIFEYVMYGEAKKKYISVRLCASETIMQTSLMYMR
jgi:hypothetical protein